MKNIAIIISILIGTIGYLNFEFNKENPIDEIDITAPKKDKFFQINFESKYLGFRFYGAKKLTAKEDLMYNVRSRYDDRLITIRNLKNAALLSDFISEYPSKWIDVYNSVDISVVIDDLAMNATSKNDTLNVAQKKMLNSIDESAYIIVQVNYKRKNAAINRIDNQEMNIEMTVVPEVEATYIGGHSELINYLKENSVDHISDERVDRFQQASFMFTINKVGKVIDVGMDKTTGDVIIDQLFIDLISNMSNWKPAENSVGAKVNQRFVFNVGRMGC